MAASEPTPFNGDTLVGWRAVAANYERLIAAGIDVVTNQVLLDAAVIAIEQHQRSTGRGDCLSK